MCLIRYAAIRWSSDNDTCVIMTLLWKPYQVCLRSPAKIAIEDNKNGTRRCGHTAVPLDASVHWPDDVAQWLDELDQMLSSLARLILHYFYLFVVFHLLIIYF